MEMKILLSYSKKHFEPGKYQSPHSAGVLARALYEVLSTFGEVKYMDWNGGQYYSEGCDLLVALPRNIKTIIRVNRPEKIICFPAIAEPNFTKRVLSDEAHKLGCKLSDSFTPDMYIPGIKYLIIGNTFVKQQYLNAGYQEEDICMLDYGMPGFDFKTRVKSKEITFLHVATTLGLRKGFYHVINDFIKANIPNSKLICMGRIQHGERFWYDFVNSINDARIEIKLFIDSYTEEYKKILESANYFIYPSLSEGQPGTVLEAMASGLIPILSEESGIDYYPFGKYIRGETSVLRKASDVPNGVYQIEQMERKKLINEKYNIDNFKKEVKDYVQSYMG